MRVSVVVVLLFGAARALPAYLDPMVNPGMFEGDILGFDPNEDRNAVTEERRRWPNGLVPYEIDESLKNQTDLIKKGMKHIAERTCINFAERKPEHKDYIRIFYGIGCYSLWGHTGGMQPLSLGNGCHYFGSVVHELMHALGFEHEHNRSDRDDYIKINWDNIEKTWYYAFEKLKPNENRLLSPFDYGSIMLYGQSAFAKELGLKTIEAKDGRFLPEPYHKNSMTASDFERVIALYECRKPLE